VQLLSDPQFWFGLGQVALINVVLSADNAIVIALAARSLPVHQQTRAVVYGAGAVIVFRIALTLLAAELLRWPYLKFIGAMLLFWIAVKLLVSEHGSEKVESSDRLVNAIKIILIADLIMSLDNVIAVAAAAKGDTALVIIGLAISIPLVIFGATALMRLMGRWPVIITVGAGLLGWVAGDMLMTDPVWAEWVNMHWSWLRVRIWKLEFNWAQVAGAVLVVLWGRHLASMAAAQRKVVPVETSYTANQSGKEMPEQRLK
jgi:YjbE family integral membrane protein